LVGLGEIAHRRAVLVYVVVIAVPALVLLYFGIESFEREREAVATLVRSNQHLSGERVAAELERRTTQLAQDCLRQAEGVPLYKTELDRLRAAHPVARYFFAVQGGRVVYPPLHTAPPRSLEDMLTPERPAVRTEYAAAFEEAERQELRQQNCEAAIVNYRKAASLNVSGSLKALALFRVARSLEKTNRTAEARRSYQAVASEYPDLTDPANRPYALVSAVAINESAGPNAELWRDVLRGRWPLSAGQVEFFAARIGDGSSPGPETYLAHLNFARGLEEHFHPPVPLQPGDVHSFAFGGDGSSYQLFYLPLPAPRSETVLLGLAVDPDWIQDRLLPQCRAELKLAETVRIISKSAPAAAGSEARVGFKSLFPFWDLSVASSSGIPGRAGLLAQAATTILVLALLLIGVLLILRDLSREARMNQLRADFVGAVSHELKTPITLIRLYGETLLENEDFPPGQRREFYEIITRESERLTQLIEKVLSFSKIERGEKQYRLQTGDLAPVVARTVEAYEPYLRRRGFSVETQLAAPLPAVRFDADAVSQALVNLVDNALKYSGDIKAVAIRSYVRAGAVVLEVEDHGIGIPREEHEKIFQRFYRVKNAVAKGGYGLGLYLVRHIMDAHGGAVELESEPGRGSRFGLAFPLACGVS
jgi:signal transduction histidine kinase